MEDNANQRIWQVVAAIPPGRVATYGDVAARAGMPGAARRVGHALHVLPPGTAIPWHRVVNAGGRIALPADSAPHRLQRERLSGEGVQFSPGGAIDLRRYRWQ